MATVKTSFQRAVKNNVAFLYSFPPFYHRSLISAISFILSYYMNEMAWSIADAASSRRQTHKMNKQNQDNCYYAMLIQVKAVLSCSVTSVPLRYGNLISRCIQISSHFCVSPISLLVSLSLLFVVCQWRKFLKYFMYTWSVF